MAILVSGVEEVEAFRIDRKTNRLPARARHRRVDPRVKVVVPSEEISGYPCFGGSIFFCSSGLFRHDRWRVDGENQVHLRAQILDDLDVGLDHGTVSLRSHIGIFPGRRSYAEDHGTVPILRQV